MQQENQTISEMQRSQLKILIMTDVGQLGSGKPRIQNGIMYQCGNNETTNLYEEAIIAHNNKQQK